MTFSSKTDAFFVTFISIAVLIIAAVTIWPLFLDGGDELSVVITLAATFILSAGLILWCSFGVKYVFHEDHLFVKGGPFRSRIPYNSITKVAPTSSIFVGYRILSSKDALEIFYPTAILGSVKISPKDKERFLKELEKRCPGLKIAS